jgi:Ni/Co efflux regulator RcnB
MKRLVPLVLIFAWLAAPLPLAADESAAESDAEAIRAAALDYLEGWYTGDADRMERALHPDLAKRIVRPSDDGPDRVDNMSALRLVQATRAGWGTRVPSDQRRADVVILDVFGNAATVRADARDWVDYLHLGKVDGEWKIINVLWEMRPRPETPTEEGSE